MNKTLSILTEGQDPVIRKQMIRRFSVLMTSVRFMKEKKSEHFVAVEKRGWTLQRLEVLFALNTFYLLVLGPLAASAKGRSKTMWRNVPILYGEELLFDNDRAHKIRAAQLSFSSVVSRVPGGLETLTGNQASDIIFRLFMALNDQAEPRSLD
ncbi:MAG: hypothetical protein LZF61_06630 [Nitrosomonas sp.]|nr:MAG: hypothetical protein LZF61_06630 [Nitrosomonas sp.]